VSIQVTIHEIRALIELAALDMPTQESPSESHRSHREAGRRRVARALLERYESLLDAGRRPAIAAIERSRCSGCHLRLPTMVASQARRSPSVHTCPHCRRMLYAPELLTAEDLREVGSQKKGAPDRAALVSGAERY
jgi:predicted  nucleic acid-binding Zn-ribbon protein